MSQAGDLYRIVPGWEKIFVECDIDLRHVSWGGVLIDDRAYDTTDIPCNFTSAADNPKVSNAEDAIWLKDDDIVFGIGINGAYRAYPRRIMEVCEMVNNTLGGRVISACPIARSAAPPRRISPTNFRMAANGQFYGHRTCSSAPTK